MPNPAHVIAVVDDEEINREALGRLLTVLGYGVELYESAELFLVALGDSKARCLLVDINLGGISGIELARGLATAGFRRPIIFMTASADERIRKRALDAGCVAFLPKPFHPTALAQALVAAGLRDSID